MNFAERKKAEDRLALKLALKERRADDPLLQFVPHPKQAAFIRAVLKKEKKENYFFGANRSGKSDVGAYIGATLARFGDRSGEHNHTSYHEGGKLQVTDHATSGWVVSLDFPSSRDIIQPKYFDNGFVPPGANHPPFIPAREIAEWRVSDQILKLKNGSILGYKSGDSGASKFQGTEKEWIHFDEQPPKAVYEECTIRIGPRPLNIFATCTLLPPEGVVGGVSWMFSDKIRPWQRGELPNLGVVTAAIYDNPYLLQDEIEHLESLYPEGSVQRRIRLNGELIGGLFGARVYSSFDHKLHIREQPPILLRRPLAWVWDFNVEPMVSFIGQRDRQLFRVFREITLPEGNIQEMCDAFRQIHPTHMANVIVYGDASGKDRSHQTKMSSYHIILSYLSGYPAPLILRVPEKNPGVADRINAVNRALLNSRREIEIEVDPSCLEMIEDMDSVMSDGRGGIKKTYNKKDPYYKRTHLSDALGYWISFEAPVQAPRQEFRGRSTRIKSPSYGAGLG